MEGPPKPVKRPSVLNKLNTESLNVIERGLLGDLPDRLKPNYLQIPVRGHANQLAVTKPSGFLSSCLPVIPDTPSPCSERAASDSDDEVPSPLRKSFSFRHKFTRISFLKKNKDDKPKIIVEDTGDDDHGDEKEKRKHDIDYKSSKRFWHFKSKELSDRKGLSPIYQRSKSFEFLPQTEEEKKKEQPKKKSKKRLKNTLSDTVSSYDSNETMGDAWGSNDSLDYISNVYYHNDDTVFLKSIKEISSDSSKQSSLSTVNTSSSGFVTNIFERGSVQNLLDEFDKAVDLFSENYLSDCESYTQTDKEVIKEKRKSVSFSTLPSPKVLQVAKVSEVSEEFKSELSKLLSERRMSFPCSKSCRRGSVTDWFVLEDSHVASVVTAGSASEVINNKYRRAQKKPINRVRRMSSTKYWITPEECAVYTREQRPPLVIPRITQYRPPRREPRPTPTNSFSEESPSQDAASIKSSVRQYDRLQEWSPTSERSHLDVERGFEKASSDSFVRLHNKRYGGSTENLLLANNRRPNHLQLPPSSSGDSLDVEVRDRDLGSGYGRSRKSQSMVAPKYRMRSPVPAPRMMLPHTPEVGAVATVFLEGPVKRTKFSECGKKCRKNWIECYMVLTPTALIFYKDQKTYNATKVPRPPGTPPSPTAPRAELVLALKNAHIMQCIQMHTRRYTRSLVLTVGYDQYLLQDETEEGAKTWLKYIQTVYYKLGPQGEDLGQHHSSTTDGESLGRTPPPSRHATKNQHKAGGSSNEDLSDSTEVSKSHVKRRLRNFFAKRPTMDSLVKKGIYQEEPVFGRKLEEVCPPASPRVPEFVVACVREIESNEENMTTDGLYRASGNLSQVQKIRLEVDQNNLTVIENNTDIHVLTGSLKLFFRELKEPLIPCSMFGRVLAACSIKPREAKIKEFRDIVHALPQCNRDTLKFLLEHLMRVTQYSERNRMSTANLAIVFGPTLLWAPAEQAHNIAIDCIQQNHVVETFLNDYKDIFEEKGKKKS